MSAYFSLPKTDSTLPRSNPNMTNITKSILSGSNEGLARSTTSLSGSNPRLKIVRRSSTVETAEIIIRWLHFYSIIYF